MPHRERNVFGKESWFIFSASSQLLQNQWLKDKVRYNYRGLHRDFPICKLPAACTKSANVRTFILFMTLRR